jgi:hypothetical protein
MRLERLPTVNSAKRILGRAGVTIPDGLGDSALRLAGAGVRILGGLSQDKARQISEHLKWSADATIISRNKERELLKEQNSR